jgi:ATP-dependent DNA helicase RecG
VGSTNREASADELARMFQSAGRIQYGLKPVPGTTFGDLDARRLNDYLRRVLGGAAPAEGDIPEWERRLSNLELMVRSDGAVHVTVDGMLLFGALPKRFLPQSGIRALAFPGTRPDYAAVADEDLRGPMTPLCARDGAIVEAGLVEQALAFLARNAPKTAALDGARRVDRPVYPPDVLREVLVNALVHRDYSIAGTDVTMTLFIDRLEVKSPGRLPNTCTVEALREGFRYARNQTLVNIMRDYRYVDFRGMGIRDKVIPGMLAHNGTEAELVETERDFTVRLWATKPP